MTPRTGHPDGRPTEHFLAEERRHDMLDAAARRRLAAGLSAGVRRSSRARRLGRAAGGWFSRMARGRS